MYQMKKRNKKHVFYRVHYEANDFSKQQYSHTEIFEDKNLLQARIKAFDYYYNRLEQVFIGEMRFFGQDFASPSEFILGKHFAFFIDVLMVVKSKDSDEEETPVFGSSFEPQMQDEYIKYEKYVLENMGFSI